MSRETGIVPIPVSSDRSLPTTRTMFGDPANSQMCSRTVCHSFAIPIQRAATQTHETTRLHGLRPNPQAAVEPKGPLVERVFGSAIHETTHGKLPDPEDERARPPYYLPVRHDCREHAETCTDPPPA